MRGRTAAGRDAHRAAKLPARVEAAAEAAAAHVEAAASGHRERVCGEREQGSLSPGCDRAPKGGALPRLTLAQPEGPSGPLLWDPWRIERRNRQR